MNEKEVTALEDRRKRVQRLKAMVSIFYVILLVLPSLFCVILSMRIDKLEKQINVLKTESVKSLEIVWNDRDGEETVVSEKESSSQEELEEEITAEEGLQPTEGSQPEEAIQSEKETIEQGVEDPYAGYRKVYLTFDDGPSPHTDKILDVLRKYNVKATFFVNGSRASYYEGKFQKILDEGHALGNHSYGHVFQDVYESLESFQEDFYKLNNYIYDTTGQDTKIYRFPGGSANTAMTVETRTEILEWMKEQGIVHFDWNVSSGDGSATPPDAEELAERCISGVRDQKDTAIVLMHDSSAKKSTLEALPYIIEGISQMENTVFLPIDTQTKKIQQRSLTEE